MKDMTEKTMVEAGGKVWEKGTLKRVYLNADACKNIIEQASYSAMEEKSLKKAKTYFDCESNELKSDVGTVRVMFNRIGMECSK